MERKVIGKVTTMTIHAVETETGRKIDIPGETYNVIHVGHWEDGRPFYVTDRVHEHHVDDIHLGGIPTRREWDEMLIIVEELAQKVEIFDEKPHQEQ